MIVTSTDAAPGTANSLPNLACVIRDIWLYVDQALGNCALVTLPDGSRKRYVFLKDGSMQPIEK